MLRMCGTIPPFHQYGLRYSAQFETTSRFEGVSYLFRNLCRVRLYWYKKQIVNPPGGTIYFFPVSRVIYD